MQWRIFHQALTRDPSSNLVFDEERQIALNFCRELAVVKVARAFFEPIREFAWEPLDAFSQQGIARPKQPQESPRPFVHSRGSPGYRTLDDSADSGGNWYL